MHVGDDGASGTAWVCCKYCAPANCLSAFFLTPALRGLGVSRGVTDFPSPPPPLPSATTERFPRRPFSVGKSRRGAPIGRRAGRRTRQGGLVRGKWAGASKNGSLRAPGLSESGSVASMCSADPGGGENSPSSSSSSSALPPLSSSFSPKGNFAGDATSHRKCGWKTGNKCSTAFTLTCLSFC